MAGPIKSIREWWRGLENAIKSLLLLNSVIAVIAGFVAGFYSSVLWIRASARNAVLGDAFLGKLSERIRPSCIFDSHGSIEADMGTGEYVESLTVTPVQRIYGFEVVVKAKRHLAYAPLVVGLNANLYPVSSTREKGNDWKIVLQPNSTQSSTETR
jgi:hypothetical protein